MRRAPAPSPRPDRDREPPPARGSDPGERRQNAPFPWHLRAIRRHPRAPAECADQPGSETSQAIALADTAINGLVAALREKTAQLSALHATELRRSALTFSQPEPAAADLNCARLPHRGGGRKRRRKQSEPRQKTAGIRVVACTKMVARKARPKNPAFNGPDKLQLAHGKDCPCHWGYCGQSCGCCRAHHMEWMDDCTISSDATKHGAVAVARSRWRAQLPPGMRTESAPGQAQAADGELVECMYTRRVPERGAPPESFTIMLSEHGRRGDIDPSANPDKEVSDDPQPEHPEGPEPAPASMPSQSKPAAVDHNCARAQCVKPPQPERSRPDPGQREAAHNLSSPKGRGSPPYLSPKGRSAASHAKRCKNWRSSPPGRKYGLAQLAKRTRQREAHKERQRQQSVPKPGEGFGTSPNGIPVTRGMAGHYFKVVGNKDGCFFDWARAHKGGCTDPACPHPHVGGSITGELHNAPALYHAAEKTSAAIYKWFDDGNQAPAGAKPPPASNQARGGPQHPHQLPAPPVRSVRQSDSGVGEEPRRLKGAPRGVPGTAETTTYNPSIAPEPTPGRAGPWPVRQTTEHKPETARAKHQLNIAQRGLGPERRDQSEGDGPSESGGKQALTHREKCPQDPAGPRGGESDNPQIAVGTRIDGATERYSSPPWLRRFSLTTAQSAQALHAQDRLDVAWRFLIATLALPGDIAETIAARMAPGRKCDRALWIPHHIVVARARHAGRLDCADTHTRRMALSWTASITEPHDWIYEHVRQPPQGDRDLGGNVWCENFGVNYDHIYELAEKQAHFDKLTQRAAFNELTRGTDKALPQSLAPGVSTRRPPTTRQPTDSDRDEDGARRRTPSVTPEKADRYRHLLSERLRHLDRNKPAAGRVNEGSYHRTALWITTIHPVRTCARAAYDNDFLSSLREQHDEYVLETATPEDDLDAPERASEEVELESSLETGPATRVLKAAPRLPSGYQSDILDPDGYFPIQIMLGTITRGGTHIPAWVNRLTNTWQIKHFLEQHPRSGADFNRQRLAAVHRNVCIPLGDDQTIGSLGHVGMADLVLQLTIQPLPTDALAAARATAQTMTTAPKPTAPAPTQSAARQQAKAGANHGGGERQPPAAEPAGRGGHGGENVSADAGASSDAAEAQGRTQATAPTPRGPTQRQVIPYSFNVRTANGVSLHLGTSSNALVLQLKHQLASSGLCGPAVLPDNQVLRLEGALLWNTQTVGATGADEHNTIVQSLHDGDSFGEYHTFTGPDASGDLTFEETATEEEIYLSTGASDQICAKDTDGATNPMDRVSMYERDDEYERSCMKRGEERDEEELETALAERHYADADADVGARHAAVGTAMTSAALRIKDQAHAAVLVDEELHMGGMAPLDTPALRDQVRAAKCAGDIPRNPSRMAASLRPGEHERRCMERGEEELDSSQVEKHYVDADVAVHDPGALDSLQPQTVGRNVLTAMRNIDDAVQRIDTATRAGRPPTRASPPAPASEAPATAEAAAHAAAPTPTAPATATVATKAAERDTTATGGGGGAEAETTIRVLHVEMPGERTVSALKAIYEHADALWGEHQAAANGGYTVPPPRLVPALKRHTTATAPATVESTQAQPTEQSPKTWAAAEDRPTAYILIFDVCESASMHWLARQLATEPQTACRPRPIIILGLHGSSAARANSEAAGEKLASLRNLTSIHRELSQEGKEWTRINEILLEAARLATAAPTEPRSLSQWLRASRYRHLLQNRAEHARARAQAREREATEIRAQERLLEGGTVPTGAHTGELQKAQRWVYKTLAPMGRDEAGEWREVLAVPDDRSDYTNLSAVAQAEGGHSRLNHSQSQLRFIRDVVTTLLEALVGEVAWRDVKESHLAKGARRARGHTARTPGQMETDSALAQLLDEGAPDKKRRARQEITDRALAESLREADTLESAQRATSRDKLAESDLELARALQANWTRRKRRKCAPAQREPGQEESNPEQHGLGKGTGANNLSDGPTYFTKEDGGGQAADAHNLDAGAGMDDGIVANGTEVTVASTINAPPINVMPINVPAQVAVLMDFFASQADFRSKAECTAMVADPTNRSALRPTGPTYPATAPLSTLEFTDLCDRLATKLGSNPLSYIAKGVTSAE